MADQRVVPAQLRRNADFDWSAFGRRILGPLVYNNSGFQRLVPGAHERIRSECAWKALRGTTDESSVQAGRGSKRCCRKAGRETKKEHKNQKQKRKQQSFFRDWNLNRLCIAQAVNQSK